MNDTNYVHPSLAAAAQFVQTEQAEETIKKIAESEKPLFQSYKSHRANVRLITLNGKVINFINGQFNTADSDCIRYLESELTRGMTSFIERGDLVTTERLDPMYELKQQWMEEGRKQVEAAVKGDRNFGETENAAQAVRKKLAGMTTSAGVTTAASPTAIQEKSAETGKEEQSAEEPTEE